MLSDTNWHLSLQLRRGNENECCLVLLESVPGVGLAWIPPPERSCPQRERIVPQMARNEMAT